MRTLFLLRGAPGSGKSTWVSRNKLEPYTIASDVVRTLVTGPEIDCMGKLNISQKKDGIVWDLILKLLEERMKNGEMVIIDATHYRKGLLNNYKDLAKKYRYRQIVVDFTTIKEEVCIERNSGRDEFKVVPEEVIHKMYSVFRNENDLKEINSSFEVMLPDNAYHLINYGYNPINIASDKYKKVIVIPDIHGCYNTLLKVFDSSGGIRDDFFYVFLGDYFDRGPDSVDVFKKLNEIKDKPNVMLIEGNHEEWFRHYVNNDIDQIKSNSFKNQTMKQFDKFLEDNKLTKKYLKPFMQKFVQCGYLKIDHNIYLFTHGGVPLLTPDLKVHTRQLIKGTGGYSDIEQTYEGWKKAYSSSAKAPMCDYFQFHGHRNNDEAGPAFCDNHVFNLCTHVEYGSNMRVGVIDVVLKDINVIEILNAENKAELLHIDHVINKESINSMSNESLFDAMRQHRYISVKTLPDNIESFNFTRDAFYKAKWDMQTCLARGLFVRDNKIIARGYNKFFNLGENKDSSIDKLKFTYPVNVYKKYNGFLGLLSYDSVHNSLFFSTKSSTSGDHAKIFKENFESIIPNIETQVRLREFIKNNNVTLLFEVIDERDPHIMDIEENTIVLLDVVHNDVNGETIPYTDLVNVANSFGFKVKEQLCTINNDSDFNNLTQNILPSMEKELEGVVLEDASQFRIKIKGNFYLYWKYIRGLIPKVLSHKPISYIYPQDATVVGFMKTLDEDKLKNISVPELRKLYYMERK